MKRLTIGVKACTEIMGLLVTMAWADGVLADQEKVGLRAAAKTLNLEQGLRDRLESFMSEDPGLGGLEIDGLSVRDREFAYVASAWMARVDAGVADEEADLLEKVGMLLEVGSDRRKELSKIAAELEPPSDDGSWSDGIVQLFGAILKSIEQVDVEEEIDIAFE
jgi:hypothetical protein